MNAWNFADIRKFGRDVLDVSTATEEMKVGIVGRVYGLVVRVTRAVPKGTLLVHDGDRCLYHVMRDESEDEIHAGRGEPGECDVCFVYRTMAR